MIFHVATYEGSSRIKYIEDLLEREEIRYKLHVGKVSFFGWDEHKNTCIKIIKENYNEPFIVIAEDDLEFTISFSKKVLEEYILQKKSHIICTGIFCEEGLIKKGNDVYVDSFRGTQLIIIFKEVYDLILDKYKENKFFETILSEINIKKAVTFPFLSYQTDKFISKITQHKQIKNHILKTEKNIKNEM